MLKFNWQSDRLLGVSKRKFASRAARIFSLVLCLTSSLASLQSTSAAEVIATSTHDADEQAIRAQAADYSKAFAAGDVSALLAMWSDNAVLTDQFGKVASGKDAIRAQMTSFFTAYGKQPLEIKIDSLEFPADNLAIEHGTSHVGTTSNPASYSTYTAVHVKRDGNWQMVNVSESPRYDANAATVPSISELSWLVGNWSVEGPRGNLQIKADWVAGKKMIRCDFDATTKDGEKTSQTQFIFYDPLFKRIRSWQYDWSGGYGESRWFKSGNGTDWESDGCSVQPDGSTGSARYLFKKVDNNTFTWQSTSRRLLGRRLPDSAVLTAKRTGS